MRALQVMYTLYVIYYRLNNDTVVSLARSIHLFSSIAPLEGAEGPLLDGEEDSVRGGGGLCLRGRGLCSRGRGSLLERASVGTNMHICRIQLSMRCRRRALPLLLLYNCCQTVSNQLGPRFRRKKTSTAILLMLLHTGTAARRERRMQKPYIVW